MRSHFKICCIAATVWSFGISLSPDALAADWISETDVVQTVVKQNYSVLATLFGPQIAEAEIMRAKSQFDTRRETAVPGNVVSNDFT